MSAIKLKDNIYYVGAINPNLRVFDIIMKTEYGTSYNAYLLVGEKIALVETVHEHFFDIFLDNIKEVIDPSNIDYIVMNHTEPDHSGSIKRLLDINPNITVVASTAALKNVTNITNMTDMKQQVVKTGDKLDLGKGLVLEFTISPNLHWPDSMFTFIPSSKTVFTCDFLGAHYCEPLIVDNHITYRKEYMQAFEYYYNAIFGPFKKFVLDGLSHLEKMDFDMVCTSHGPVLKNEYQNAISLYKEWSTPTKTPQNVAIFYVSAYGYTRRLAEVMAEEIEKAGIPVKIFDVIHHDSAELSEALEKADGLLFGSPTINRDALKPIWDLISSIDAVGVRGKLFQVFGSYGWSGEAGKMLFDRLTSLGLKSVAEPFKVQMKPSESDENNAKELARSFAAAL